MKLYKQDFLVRSATDTKLIEKYKKVFANGFASAGKFLRVPNRYYQLTELFPNNYLDISILLNKNLLKTGLKKFKTLLSRRGTTEREITKFIKDNEAYFIIGSLLNNYDFGHHGAYLFPEFKLGTDFQVDYLLVGKNSGGYEFIFIELEAVHGNVTVKDGNLGKSIVKGVRQVEDWNQWLQINFDSLKSLFKKALVKEETLPSEFYEFDNSRIHFVVVAGTRKDYSERTYRIRRTKKRESNILVLHYDNLADLLNNKIKRGESNY